MLIHPFEAEFGWSRTAIATAASLNLLLLGLFAPIGGWLIDRLGARRVILGCLATIVAGLIGTVFVRELWQFIILWGVVLGVATGVTPPLGASIASRWFVDRRGLAIGIMTNANAAGQVVYLPLLMAIIVGSGWRSALWAMAAASAVLLPAIWLWMRDRPADVGLEPYTAARQSDVSKRGTYARGEIRPMSISSISEVFKTSTFWILSGCFFICGVTANGLIGTHLIPHAIERGIPQMTAAMAVGIMGGASFVGTTFSGWMVDRVDPRKVLAVVYALRGSSLFILPYVSESPGLFLFAVLYGLDWYASGPATTTIIARIFGPERVGSIFGLVFLPPTRRRRRSDRRRLGTRSFRRLSVRLSRRRMSGIARSLPGPYGALDRAPYRRHAFKNGIRRSVKAACGFLVGVCFNRHAQIHGTPRSARHEMKGRTRQ